MLCHTITIVPYNNNILPYNNNIVPYNNNMVPFVFRFGDEK